ncbi:MAG: hypothetical protein IKN04_02080 [Clostridia bacterium]|nr:hypothetical protein [Clostridia bacterium]
MKKSIWIILPIVIIAVVLVAVFVGQRNTLSDQLAQLQAERSDLSRQLNEADIAAKTAQELAENNRLAMEEKVQEAETKIQEAESKVLEAETKIQEAEGRAQEAEGRAQEAEGKAQEAVEALSVATTERDELQANANTAAEQLTVGIKQVQDALGVLGVSQDEDAVAVELEATKAALDAVTAELETLKSDSETQAAQAATELQQAQDALAVMTGERDQLQAAVEAAAAQALELENLQKMLTAVTAERDELAVAKTAASILDTSESVVATFDNVSDLKLNELTLQPGEYIIRILLINAAGNEIGHYDMPYVVSAE